MIDQAFKAVKWQGRLVANQKPVDFFPKPIFLMPPLHNGLTAKYTSISSVNKMVHSTYLYLYEQIFLRGQTMILFVCYDLVVIIFFFKTKMISVSDVTVRRGSNSK